MRPGLVAAALLATATPVAAMPVGTFLSKFQDLEGKGSLATLTSDASLLKKELQDDAAALRAERLAASSAGKTPAYCPAAGSAQPTLEEIVEGLKAVPEAERSHTDVKDALRAFMARRFPCDR